MAGSAARRSGERDAAGCALLLNMMEVSLAGECRDGLATLVTMRLPTFAPDGLRYTDRQGSHTCAASRVRQRLRR